MDVEWPEFDPATGDYLELGQFSAARQMSTETERMQKYTYFTETWPSLLQPRATSASYSDVGTWRGSGEGPAGMGSFQYQRHLRTLSSTLDPDG